MEKVLCAAHGFPCFLKTGIKDGPNKNKSFYVCGVQGQPPCGFVLPTQLCPSHCLIHEEYVVDLQVLIQQQGTDQYRLFYRCAQCKEKGKKWCGSVPWQDSQPTSLSTKSQSHQKLDLPPNQRDQRNPFKVPGKNQEPLTLEQSKNYEAKNSKEKDKERLDSDKKNQQKISLDYVGKELTKESKIKFGDKSGGSSRGVKESQTKSSDLSAGLQETQLLNMQKSSVKKAEVPSGHIRQSSSMRTAEDGMQKQETGSSSQKSSMKPLNEEQLGKGGSESCIDKRIMERTHDSGGSEKRTVTPRGLVTVCECTDSPTVSPGEKPLLHRGMTPEEKQSTNRNTSGDEHDRCVPSESAVGLTVNSLHEKDCSQKNSPSISEGSAPLQRTEILESKALHSQLSAQLKQKKSTLKMVNVQALPDKGKRLLKQVEELEAALNSLNLETEDDAKEAGHAGIIGKEEQRQHNPFSRTTVEPLNSTLEGKGPQMFHEQENTRPLEFYLPAGSNQYCSNPSGEYSSVRNLYGGRMTEERLRAVYNATADAINDLHKSLKSCPTEEAVAVDPPGLKVSLLVHQKQALAWLLWRENQAPCGGMLADDMGLGKTLTMIALVLTQKRLQKEKKVEICMSRQDSSVIFSNGTLIVCPASLIHHWKKEVERHVNNGKLRVCLYHGPNRNKNTTVLSGYDIVITTYSILGKEIPTHKEEAEVAAKDHVEQDKSLPFSPLLWINWARIILDEAHSIRNPKVQASIAACKLRATARWAVTGTPIQNNLLDMYSLLRFLRCSPFDEFKVWKSQVDNNTRKGGERLAILTRSLLLRRTKDQLDSSGKPLVSLPQRLTQLHRLKLSGDEQLVYDVLFARSRSTLQSYLNRQEAQSTERAGDNPFERVSQQFRDGQWNSVGKANTDTPVSTTVHILSLLLRLRQCCSHLSLLKTALEQASLDSEGISLSLEEQLSALTLSEPDSSDPRSTVYLLGSPFGVDLFEITKQSTKLSHLLEELKAIQDLSQKSVVVSQWTSMLKVVAVHLEKLGLKYATIDGSVNPKQRMDVVEEFNSNPKGPQVMLISLLAGGVGLNLTGGNHLFLLDMHWNPALEDQACDRIYRVGQQKDVVIHRFVCEGTVEEKISQLQAVKKELAQKVLSGRGDSFTKLTLADLKLLFGI